MDLFSGTGGFAEGLLKAGFTFKKHYFSETDQYAIGNYLYHFKNSISLGDVRKIKIEKIEKPNVITFGSPCQDISIAGRRTGIRGKRSSLFFEAVRLIDKYKPEVFIFENVKGLFSSNDGKDFERVLRTLADIGLYDIEWQLLNSRWLLPQNRERIYVVGRLRGSSRRQIFPIGKGYERNPTSNKFTKKDLKICPTIDTRVGATTHRSPYILVNNKSIKSQIIFHRGLNADLKESDRLRKFTPIECERLQGFSDNWTKHGVFHGEIKEISDAQRYKLLGNAVSVPLVEVIGSKLINAASKDQQHFVLSGLGDANVEVPEIKVTYERSTSKMFPDKMQTSTIVAEFIRKTFNEGEIEYQEQFIVLYLNSSLKVIGYYKHSKGTYTGTVSDIRIVLAIALKCAAVGLILAHNHPSGQSEPSGVDKELTDKFKAAAKLLNLTIMDHIIVTKDNHYSFGDEGLLGVRTINALPDNFRNYVETIESDLKKGIKHNKLSIEKLAFTLDIKDRTEIKELTELAIVNVARQLASTNETTQEKFEKIVDLYNHQVNLSHRTSQSILLQQYSTPAPIAYLMGIFCNLDKLRGKAFEPSAGNGLLTIAGKPENIIVNEVDNVRNRNLKTQGFLEVTNSDASKPFLEYQKQFAAVITNPPFGRLDDAVKFDAFPIRILDHVMSLLALDTMADHGKAAIIIGNHSTYDIQGRLQKGKNRLFFNYLYKHYNVKDVIPIDGRYLYTRQGTGVRVRLILISGRKAVPEGAAPLKRNTNTSVVKSFDDLYSRVMQFVEINSNEMNLAQIKKKAEQLRKRFGLDEELGAVYIPASTSTMVLKTQVPDSMSYETQAALEQIKKEVGGDIDNFVRHRLGFATMKGLHQVLAAEQIDAVAMAIYNIEAKNQGMIIGDQTGIGKGRVAASMIRYGVKQGLKPIFITEKANLFSDIYRDLEAIGSGHLRPFIINTKEPKTDIKDEDGEVVYEALGPVAQDTIFETGIVPDDFDFVVATYTQFNSPLRKRIKPDYLRKIAVDNIMILDESHNSSGGSNTGGFMQSVVGDTRGIVFLSATFAKSPQNMPIYAKKTCISECNLSREGLVKAIVSGGVALQEVLSSQLVAEGQMIRRERSFEGIKVNFISLDTYETEHKKTADKITNILRYIIAFQETYVTKKVKILDSEIAIDGKQAAKRGGTSQAGIDNQPYFSKVFNVINQMLFSIKAEAVADLAIQRLRQGLKPVIAFASTMGSFIEQMENEEGTPVKDGDTIQTDFSEVLHKGLDGVLRYTVYNSNGEPSYESFTPEELGPQAKEDYDRIREEIINVSTGISISPIDIVIQKLEAAGYSVAEVTGRKFKLELKGQKGKVNARKKFTTNDAFRKFNNNEIDVLMINQSGSTGASAHAIVTSKVPLSEVKQRVMMILQAEGDINTEVQKWGRINRTGQVLDPMYDYITSCIPAERRLMMMSQVKLKSLDANTTSNQKQSNNILNVPDFLNKYGDRVVAEYINDHPEIDKLLDYPLSSGLTTETSDGSVITDGANKVSGRVAVLSTKMQTEFYNEIIERYNDYVEYMKQIGEYDLEVEAIDLKAETLEKNILKMGKGGESAFGEDSYLEKVNANILKKPFNVSEIESQINEALVGKSAAERREELLKGLNDEFQSSIQQYEKDINNRFEKLIENVPYEKKIKKLEQEDVDAFLDAIEDRKKELTQEWKDEINNLVQGKSGKEESVRRIFKFFTIGKKLAYPAYPKSNSDMVLAICLGVIIDKKKKNPYNKSAIKIRIAIANSNKYVNIPASRSEDIDKIISFSHDIKSYTLPELLSDWDKEVKSRTKDRGLRYIVTGNLLQAFDKKAGKLVSYTTINGETKKGILMPEGWDQDPEEKQKVTVPIIKALKLLKDLSLGKTLNASENISFIRTEGGYRIIVPSSRSKGGDIYMDQDIWALVQNNKFEIASDKMQALLPENNIDVLAAILQDKHSISIDLNLNQLSIVEEDRKQPSQKKAIVLPPPENAVEENRLRIIKIRAKALALKHKLNIAA